MNIEIFSIPFKNFILDAEIRVYKKEVEIYCVLPQNTENPRSPGMYPQKKQMRTADVLYSCYGAKADAIDAIKKHLASLEDIPDGEIVMYYFFGYDSDGYTVKDSFRHLANGMTQIKQKYFRGRTMGGESNDGRRISNGMDLGTATRWVDIE